MSNKEDVDLDELDNFLDVYIKTKEDDKITQPLFQNLLRYQEQVENSRPLFEIAVLKKIQTEARIMKLLEGYAKNEK